VFDSENLEFWALWTDLASKRPNAIPYKSDFSMKILKRFLPNYFLAEWVDDHLINRLVGSALDTGFGEAHTGKNFFADYTGAELEYFTALWRSVTHKPCGVMIKRTIASQPEWRLQIEGIDLPLADEDGDVKYICGVGKVKKTFNHDTDQQNLQSSIDLIEYLDLGFGLPTKLLSPTRFYPI